MESSKAESVSEYLESLPEDRRKAVKQVRAFVKKRLPKGYKEQMQYGMISWVIPLARYPETYNKQAQLNAPRDNGAGSACADTG